MQVRAIVNRERRIYRARADVEVRRRMFPDPYFYSETPDEGYEGPCVVERPVGRDGVSASQELIKGERDVVERLTLSETAINLLLEVERSLLRTSRRELQAYRPGRMVDFREIKYCGVAHSLTSPNYVSVQFALVQSR